MDYKKKSFAIIIVTIILMVGMIWKFGLPLVDDIGRLSGEIKSYQEQIASFNRYTAYMANLKLSYKQNESDINQVDGVIVKDPNKLDFVKAIEHISDITSNKLDTRVVDEGNNPVGSSASKTASANSLYSSFTLGLKVDGTFANLLAFLVNVENMQYHGDVMSVSINRESDSKFPNATVSSYVTLKVTTAKP